MIDTVDGQQTRQQQRYLAQVAARLTDLPAEEREELLDELRQHLRDVADEGDGDLEVQLGPPDAFAAELRTSAGLEAAPTRSAGSVLGTIRDADRIALARVRSQLAVLASHPEVAEVVAGLRRSATLWWALRGYVAVLAFDVFQGGYQQLWSFPFPAVGGSRLLGLVLASLGAAASVALGRARRGGGWLPRAASRVLNVAVAIGVLVLVSTVSGAAWAGAHHDVFVLDEPAVDDGQLIGPTGERITNLYPYGPDGEPLEGVLLYDQEGRPLDLVVEHLPDGERIVSSYPLDDDGTPVTNAFPQRQILRPDPYAGDDTGFDPGYDGYDGPVEGSTGASRTDPTGRPVIRDVPVLEPAPDDDGALPGAGAEQDPATTDDTEDGPDGEGQ